MQFDKMDPTVKAKWLEALESGNYKKGKSALRTKLDSYCCLGVLCQMAVEEGVTQLIDRANEYDAYGYGPSEDLYSTAFLPQDVREWAGVEWSAETHLADVNDCTETFAEVIEIIKTQL